MWAAKRTGDLVPMFRHRSIEVERSSGRFKVEVSTQSVVAKDNFGRQMNLHLAGGTIPWDDSARAKRGPTINDKSEHHCSADRLRCAIIASSE